MHNNSDEQSTYILHSRHLKILISIIIFVGGIYISSQDITLLHDHEIGLTILADFSNTTEQEADTGVLSLKSRN